MDKQPPIRSELFEVLHGKGWHIMPPLDEVTVSTIKDAIYNGFRSALLSNNIEGNEFSCFDDLANYHHSTVARDFHESLWSKTNRLINRESAKRLTERLNEYLLPIFREFIISDEEEIGYENIYWRLVRPFYESDVGPAHADSWFWIIAPDQQLPSGKTMRFKLWIPLIIVEGVNSLAFISGSHLMNEVKWDVKEKGGGLKPFLVSNEILEKLEISKSKPGQPVLFNDDVIHMGPINKTSKSRISIECTICVNESDLK